MVDALRDSQDLWAKARVGERVLEGVRAAAVDAAKHAPNEGQR